MGEKKRKSARACERERERERERGRERGLRQVRWYYERVEVERPAGGGRRPVPRQCRPLHVLVRFQPRRKLCESALLVRLLGEGGQGLCERTPTAAGAYQASGRRRERWQS